MRPSRSLPGVPTPHPSVDLVVIRENTEDLYRGIEFERGTPEALELREELRRLGGADMREDSGFTVKPISVSGARRIVRFALSFVETHGRRKVTLGHKANIMRFSDGLFLSIGQIEAESHPNVWFEEMEIDQLSMRLVREPQRFDVVVFKYPKGPIENNTPKNYIKRLLGLPGEILAIFFGRLFHFPPPGGAPSNLLVRASSSPLTAPV